MTLHDVTTHQQFCTKYLYLFLLVFDYSCTAHIHGRSVSTSRIYGPYSRKALQTMLFCRACKFGLYIWVTGTHCPYIRVVSCVRAICTGVKNAPVYHHTTPQPFYGPFSGTTRVSRTQCQKRTSGLHGARED